MNGISIIICTYNGKSKIAKALLSILKLQSKCDWELIIVDNASTDGTSEYVTSLLKDSEIDWRVCLENKKGLINARICGLNESKYDILLYCDDDNALQFDYLIIGHEIFSNNYKVGALGGCGIPVFENEKPNWFDTYSHSFAVGYQADKNGKINNFPAELYGAGIFLKKSVLIYFLEKGFKSGLSGRTGTNLVSGEDVEWCYLIQLLGFEIWYDCRLVFWHEMSKERMNWNYYLSLKKGIALGTGQLLPYYCLFSNKKMSDIKYGLIWFKKLFFLLIIFVKQLINYNSKNKEKQLGLIIIKAKIKSYVTNSFSAFQHFRKMKSIKF